MYAKPISAAEARPAVAVRSEVSLPLDDGSAPSLITFTGFARGEEHFVLRYGDLAPDAVPLVRVHSECITGDLFRSQRCDCGAQLEQAQAMVAAEGGLIVYLRQEGRGIGLYAKIDAYRLQDCGLDTFAANESLALPRDAREYACAAQMLRALGVHRLRLITNNPDKACQLAQAGLQVESVVPTGTFLTPHNRGYLRAKATITGHRLAC
ncbi:MAG TPA: GTP cyclohydrolase II [Ramlibacter sp.]|nr:GTP cyclohydrolase II [Ramlibacter sp.]